MGVMIGGPSAYKVRSHGDIGVSFQWVNDEPAMILFPTRRQGAGAFVICLSAAYLYADSETGMPTPYLAMRMPEAASIMGFDRNDKFAMSKIAKVVVESLPDLVSMPPEPRQAIDQRNGPELGELSIKMDGKVIHEQTVTAGELAQ